MVRKCLTSVNRGKCVQNQSILPLGTFFLKTSTGKAQETYIVVTHYKLSFRPFWLGWTGRAFTSLQCLLSYILELT